MAMNTHNTVLDNASVEATTPDGILQTALAAWRQGNFAGVVDQFNGQFTFTDHALGLEFKDKGRLTEFLVKYVNSSRIPKEGTTPSSAAETASLVNGRLRLRRLNLFLRDTCYRYPFASEAYLSCQ